MRLNPEHLAVETFHTTPQLEPADTVVAEATVYSCNLTDDDFTCADYCSSRAPGLTCYHTCSEQMV
jgi:hypothetical protein